MSITPFAKDKVLNHLCSGLFNFERLIRVNRKDVFKITELSFNELTAVLIQFGRFEFISELNDMHNSPDILMIIHLDALDFKNRGGFIGQEELLKINLEKLLSEIESLKPSLPDKVDAITSIASNISSSLALIFTGAT